MNCLSIPPQKSWMCRNLSGPMCHFWCTESCFLSSLKSWFSFSHHLQSVVFDSPKRIRGTVVNWTATSKRRSRCDVRLCSSNRSRGPESRPSDRRKKFSPLPKFDTASVVFHCRSNCSVLKSAPQGVVPLIRILAPPPSLYVERFSTFCTRLYLHTTMSSL